jgi:beta-lactam-binding protein with PASTA domain
MFLFRFLWWGTKWSFATVFFVAIMGFAGLYVFNLAVQGGKYVPVPNIERMSITEASEVLAERGLELGGQTNMANDQVPKFHVIAQRPSSNTVVRAGRKVYPTVSMGPDLKMAPSYANMTLEDAQKALAATKFSLGTTAHVPNSAPRDTVIAQYPPINEGVPKDGQIHLLLSSGPSTQSFLMPDLIGMSLEKAVATLSNLNVSAIPIQVDRDDVVTDLVLDQNPEPGSVISEGQKVYYTVKKTGVIAIENIWREVKVEYVVPRVGDHVDVRIDMVDKNKVRDTKVAQIVAGGSRVSFPVRFEGELMVECFVNGTKERSIYYEGGKEPVVTLFNTALPETTNAGA